MAYADTNFKTKKQFKEALAAGQTIRLYSPGPWQPKTDGSVCVEGPHYPAAHSWYAEVTVVNGVVTKIK
jgi:hypothetical protein